MGAKRTIDDLSVEELEQLLYRKRSGQRHQRKQRLKAARRLVELPGIAGPEPRAPFRSEPLSTGRMQERTRGAGGGIRLSPGLNDKGHSSRSLSPWRRLANKALLALEIAVVIGLVAIGANLWKTTSELNQELAQVLRAESQSLALATATATPLINVVVLPGGHKPPADGRIPEPGEAGYIPEHLLPIISAYRPPPIPTPGPEQARRIQIPAIDVDSPIVQGMYDWEQLKKGVAQYIGSANPGEVGNMALAGHNDIYGEVFRHLDKLMPGDEIIVSTQRRSYTYVVRGTKVVEPTDVWVLEPTDFASTTLVSCYPYRVNTKRIAVFADLATS